MALLLPKLRSHFAEFLNNASPVGLRILSSPTCVGLRYGYSTNNSGFSWQLAHTFPYFSSVCITSSDYRADLPTLLLPRLPRDSIPASALPLRPHSSVILQYRNFNLLSIGYVFRPHLRPRLTQSRSALLWKPWVFGRKDSHLPLATHSGILSSIQSTAPYRYCFVPYTMLLYQCTSTFLSFGSVFQPRTFSAQDLSTSELLRTLLMYGCF